jgi:hypothetical protein
VAVVGVDHSYCSDEMAGPFQDFPNCYFFQPGRGLECLDRLQVVEEAVVETFQCRGFLFFPP